MSIIHAIQDFLEKRRRMRLQRDMRQYITDMWGEQCPSMDYEDFPGQDITPCPTCEIWRRYEALESYMNFGD